MSGPLDVSGIRRDYEAAREHLNNNWACCSGHRLGAEVPLLLAEIERLKAANAQFEAESTPDVEPIPEYVYFVSYSHARGFGSSEIHTDTPLDTYAEVRKLKTTIAEPCDDRMDLRADEICILNFILLSGPKEVVS